MFLKVPLKEILGIPRTTIYGGCLNWTSKTGRCIPSNLSSALLIHHALTVSSFKRSCIDSSSIICMKPLRLLRLCLRRIAARICHHRELILMEEAVVSTVAGMKILIEMKLVLQG
jgi:hypothetical protein